MPEKQTKFVERVLGKDTVVQYDPLFSLVNGSSFVFVQWQGTPGWTPCGKSGSCPIVDL